MSDWAVQAEFNLADLNRKTPDVALAQAQVATAQAVLALVDAVDNLTEQYVNEQNRRQS